MLVSRFPPAPGRARGLGFNALIHSHRPSIDTVTLSKQILQEVFYPQSDNSYLWHNNAKKKEKVC